MIDPIAIRNLFGIQGLNIHWYGILICLGIIGGVWLAKVLAKRRGYTFEMIVDFLILALPLALIGARIYYVAFEWERYAGDFLEMISIWHGGMAIYGGVIGAVIAAIIFCKWKKIPLGDLLDIGAPPLILGQAVGRWGNFVNQEAFGNLITDPNLQWFPYGVYIERLGEWHQATFFYESLWNFIVLGALLLLWKKIKRRGNVFVWYLILYGAGRFFIEGLRTDSLWLVPGVIRVSQLLSAILVIGGIVYLLVTRNRPQKLHIYEGKYKLNVEETSEEKEQETDINQSQEEAEASYEEQKTATQEVEEPDTAEEMGEREPEDAPPVEEYQDSDTNEEEKKTAE